MLFIAGLWPFNFTEKNNAVISFTGGLEIARHGTAYTALPAGKLQALKQFAIHLDVATSSDGLDSLEKIFGYLISQEDVNLFLAQWKDGLELRVRTERNAAGMIFGADGVLEKEKRTACLIIYDGQKMHLYANGALVRRDNRGPLSFRNWSQDYPLVVGTDAGGRSQWKGTIYELAIYDRALTSDEVKGLSSPSGRNKAGTRDEGAGTSAAARQGKPADSRQPTVDSQKKRSQQQQATKQENPPVSPFTKGGGGRVEIAAGEKTPPHPDPLPPGAREITGKDAGRARRDSDRSQEAKEVGEGQKPLIHYVFKQENTYGTEFRGRKALAVRELGKGEPADLVIPERFAPYRRVFFGLDADWAQFKSNWLDLAVNIMGFIPLGILLVVQFANRSMGFGFRDSGFGTKEGLQASGIGLQDKYKAATIFIIAVVVGFVVSFAIEYLQEYLPSRDSSVRDLVTNGAGTMIGALAAIWYSRKRMA